MTFLNPAALLALIAASLPVIIHFLNLRKLKKVEISTLAFIKELQKTRIKRIKIKQWILLALRILIISFLVMAFAKPALRPESFFSSGAKTTAVIIIDNSFSMSLVEAGGSLFNQARGAAQKILANLHQGDEVSIIFTSGNRSEETAPATDFSRAKKIIEEGEISNVSVPLFNSLQSADSILAHSRNANREVYILSDMQKSRVYPEDEKHNFNLGDGLSSDTRIYMIEFPSKKTTNLSVTDFYADNQIFEKGKSVSFTAVISNYSPVSVSNSVVSLFINGKRSAQQGITLNGRETRKINFETVLNETGLLNISAQLEDDDILRDNKRYIALYVPEKINICAFADNENDIDYVKTAIEASSGENADIQVKNSAQINSPSLSQYGVVILCGGANNTAPLNRYLAGGGSIILFPGSNIDLNGYNKLCAGLGIAGADKLYRELPLSSAASFGKIDFENPVISGIFEKKEEIKISSPVITSYLKLNAGSGANIISLSGGSPFLCGYNTGGGRIMQFAVSPVAGWGDFPSKSIFAPLIQRCVSYLSVKLPAENEINAGGYIPVRLFSGAGEIKAELPNGETVALSTSAKDALSTLKFGNTTATGIYKFYSGGKLIDFSSVNFNTKESDLERMDGAAFGTFMKKENIKSGTGYIDVKDNFKTEIDKYRFGTELWKHFLILALICAIAEMILAGNSRKELTGLERE